MEFELKVWIKSLNHLFSPFPKLMSHFVDLFEFIKDLNCFLFLSLCDSNICQGGQQEPVSSQTLPLHESFCLLVFSKWWISNKLVNLWNLEEFFHFWNQPVLVANEHSLMLRNLRSCKHSSQICPCCFIGPVLRQPILYNIFAFLVN